MRLGNGQVVTAAIHLRGSAVDRRGVAIVASCARELPLENVSEDARENHHEDERCRDDDEHDDELAVLSLEPSVHRIPPYVFYLDRAPSS